MSEFDQQHEPESLAAGKESGKWIVCPVCPRHCRLSEGQTGFCNGRTASGGRVVCANYGRITSLALDSVEKKPLARFYPGSYVLSVGSYGCSLRCPFCQNYEISYAGEKDISWRQIRPDQLCRQALSLKSRGCIGLAFTYNEPLIGWEFVRDTARLAHEAGLKNVLVSNGCASLAVLEELLPYVDAMNIDLKSFRPEVYRDLLGGDLETVKAFIARAARNCHMEVTTLIVPGMNDREEEIRDIAAFIAGLANVNQDQTDGRHIPLHISRFFPRCQMTDRPPTDTGLIYRLCDAAAEYLEYVYPGNC